MTKAIAQTYNAVFEYRLGIAYLLIAGSAILVFVYGMNLYKVISTTVALERIDSQSSALDDSVASLDASYLALSSEITPDALPQYGLSQVQISQYIPADSSLGNVAFRGSGF